MFGVLFGNPAAPGVLERHDIKQPYSFQLDVCVPHLDSSLPSEPYHAQPRLISNSTVPAGVCIDHESLVTACQLSHDGRKALSAGDDNTFRLWDLDTGETLRVYLALDSGTAYFDPRPIRDESDTTPRLIHASGEIWRYLASLVPTAEGGFERVPLETYGDVVQED